MMNERLSSIMTTDVFTVKPDDTLAHVHDILLNKRFHHLPVVDDNNKLLGIITSYDLMKPGVSPEKFAETPVKEVMTSRVASLRPEELIGGAARVFLENLFHGLPITDDDGKLVGIVTTHDVLKYVYNKEYQDDF
ncbi:MAG TPA: CBS domain-containing protein [Phaeodactylibacter sp.]|nr:CBS domain-containing protein [Phaeodactylibacter sp.]